MGYLFVAIGRGQGSVPGRRKAAARHLPDSWGCRCGCMYGTDAPSSVHVSASGRLLRSMARLLRLTRIALMVPHLCVSPLISVNTRRHGLRPKETKHELSIIWTRDLNFTVHHHADSCVPLLCLTTGTNAHHCSLHLCQATASGSSGSEELLHLTT